MKFLNGSDLWQPGLMTVVLLAGDFMHPPQLLAATAANTAQIQAGYALSAELQSLSETEARDSPAEVKGESGRKDGGAESVAPACGSISGTVSTDPAHVFKRLQNILVYVDGNCDYCPPKPPHETVVVEENNKGIQPHFFVVPKGVSLKLVNGYDKDIHFAPEFTPSPVDESQTLALTPLTQGQSTEITPTRSASGNSTGHYLLRSRFHERSDGIMFVTPSNCYAIADENGRYSIGELPAGNYPLKVYTNPKRTNFAAADVTVEAGKVTVQDFILDQKKKEKTRQ